MKKGVTKGVEKGGLSLLSSESSKKDQDQQEKETPKSPVRGRAREYSQAFEIAWKAYGRKEQKFEAFAVWLVRAKEVGGEPRLLTLFLGAIRWQGPLWMVEGWKFAPYFERYLKRRKWEDEAPPIPVRASSIAARDAAVETARRLASQDRGVVPATREELEGLRQRS